MPPFTTHPCSPSDGPALARNNISAFWQDKNWVLIWPNRTLEYVISQAVLRVPRNLLNDTTHLRHQKAVDEATGEVVGYVRWELPASLPLSSGAGGVGVEEAWVEAKVKDEGVGEEERKEIEERSAGADWDYDHSMDILDRPVREIKERLMKGKGYLVLEYLAVHPDHQRQGIASMLVESGIREAERLGLDIFVHAKQCGLNVYLRAGFKLLEQIIQDATKYGGDEEYAAYFLVKEVSKS